MKQITNKLKKPKNYLPIIIVIAIIALIGGFFYWQKTQKKVAGVKARQEEPVQVKKNESEGSTQETAQGTAEETKEPTSAVTSSAATNSSPTANSSVDTQPKQITSAPVVQQAPKTITPAQTMTPTPTPAPTSTTPSVYSLAQAEDYVEDQLLILINAERARLGLTAFVSNTLLRQAAGIRASEEAVPSFAGVDHVRPDGRNFATVFPQVGYSGYTMWGENLVYGYKAQFTFNQANLNQIASQMFTSWKNSPGHYDQIKNSSYNQTGLGVVLLNQNEKTYYFGIEEFARK